MQVVEKPVAIRARYQRHARIIRALAHPTRLLILEELGCGERNVTQLTGMVGVEMATVSRHLSLLKNAGLIESDKRGAQVFYYVRAKCVLKVFDCIKAIEAEKQESGGLDL